MVNPYAERLTFLDDQTRTRRDHRKYLALIRTIALLHQHQRPVLSLARPGLDGGEGEPVAYIEASLADIAAANALAHAVLGSTLDELPPQTRRLLHLVRDLVAARAAAEGVKPREVRFTRREVREGTGWSDTQLKVHLSRLLELEYLVVRRGDGQHGARFVYELVYDGEGADGAPFLMGLIDTQSLSADQPVPEQAWNELSYDGNRSGLEEDRAGCGRPPVGGRSGGGRGAEHPETPMPGKGLSDPPSLPPQKARLGPNGAAVVAAGSYA